MNSIERCQYYLLLLNGLLENKITKEAVREALILLDTKPTENIHLINAHKAFIALKQKQPDDCFQINYYTDGSGNLIKNNQYIVSWSILAEAEKAILRCLNE